MRSSTDRLYCLQSATSDKDRELPEKLLLRCIQQIIAPRNSATQRPLSLRQIACPSCQDVQSTIQPGEQCLQRKHLDTSRGQFDGQRQPIESKTDLGDSRSIVRRHVKIRSDGLCPLDEQVHRRNVGERSAIWDALGVWECEGWDGELLFGPQAQHLAARDKEFDIWASFQQLCKQRCHCDDVFKVVQEEEPLLVVLRGLEPFQHRLRSALGEANAVSDGRNDEGRIADGSEGDKVNTIRKVVQQRLRYRQPQTCFAHPSGSDEGQQAHVWAQEQRVESLHLLLTANQRRE